MLRHKQFRMARKEGKHSLGVNTESKAEKRGKIILDELERRREKGMDMFIDRLTGNED